MSVNINVPPSPAPSETGVLRLKGSAIVDANGHEVLLKGAGLGGWLNMENFITGYPGHETEMRRALSKVLGQEKYDFFFDRFLEYFFDDKDAEFFASLGLNCLRIPFNYRHFESDLNPGVFLERGFLWLDRVINICARRGIFTILDLHAAPGGQNVDWHSDTGIHKALFWEHKEFQDRSIALWRKLAARYKGNTWVAGYNPLNEPTDKEHTRVLAWYERVNQAILEVDPEHIQFYDGNTFAADFSRFGQPLPNSVYAIHDYSNFGFPAGEPYKGTPEQKMRLESSFKRKIAYHLKHGGHIWNGEFGPVYAGPTDAPDWESINVDRYNVLKDQLSLYDQHKVSWSIWLYKDIGFQGMVYCAPDTPYMKRLDAFLQKKKRLAADAWGADTSTVKDVFDPLEAWFVKEVPHIKQRYPSTWRPNNHIGRIMRNILLSEELIPEYAAYFDGLTNQQLDEMAASFKFENCMQREGLNLVLREHAAK
ncbi:cellulase [Dacryopinax primogenitus]|uniref:Cellulase n=1 Tax=Dacryopinax primogenitus (strain DJM 731) TaxID=1858805 RepID=M5GG18_DACPD|nr:cellulase [Dacryopinax primogenitus]EJU04713.1 cellulase [Dacryopinax primogenitus]